MNTLLQRFGEWLCGERFVCQSHFAHDLRRNGRVILACRKIPSTGQSRHCESTANNALCPYHEYGCWACQEPFWKSVIMGLFQKHRPLAPDLPLIYYRIRRGRNLYGHYDPLCHWFAWANQSPIEDGALVEQDTAAGCFVMADDEHALLDSLVQKVEKRFGKRKWVRQ